MRESVLTITVLRSWNSPLYAAKSRPYSQGKQYGARLLSDALVLSQCFCRSKRSIGLSRSNFQLNTSRSKSNLVNLVFRLSSPSSNLFRFLTPSVQEKVVQSQRGNCVGDCLLRPVFRISVKLSGCTRKRFYVKTKEIWLRYVEIWENITLGVVKQ